MPIISLDYAFMGNGQVLEEGLGATMPGHAEDGTPNPLIVIEDDTTKTVIEAYCPPFLMTPKCDVQRYRYIYFPLFFIFCFLTKQSKTVFDMHYSRRSLSMSLRRGNDIKM